MSDNSQVVSLPTITSLQIQICNVFQNPPGAVGADDLTAEPGIDQVRVSRQVAVFKAVPETDSVQPAPKNPFRFGIPASER
jgi:hypothetical protein